VLPVSQPLVVWLVVGPVAVKVIDAEFHVHRAAATQRPGRVDQVVRVPSTALVLEYSARFGMRTT